MLALRTSEDEVIPSQRLFADLLEGVVTGTSGTTTPVFERIPEIDDEQGDFVFVKRTAAADVQPVALAQISVKGIPDSLPMGATVTLIAAATDTRGNPMTIPVRWSSSAENVAKVDRERGTVTAVSPGTAVITADANGKTASINLRVPAPAPPSVAQISIAGVPDSLPMGAAVVLTAAATDARGNRMAVPVRWSSSAENVAKVDRERGKVTAVNPGTVEIMAEAGEKTDIR
jgi:uncharacterized protein YjdB